MAQYLIGKDLCPVSITDEGKFRFLSIYAKNREEWLVTDFACVKAGITSVPLYDTLGKESIEYILDQCQIRTVVCSGDKVKTLCDLKRAGKISKLHTLIYFDELTEVPEGSDLTIVPYNQALTEGNDFLGV
jgi:long-chain acyl-CoA synthetase